VITHTLGRPYEYVLGRVRGRATIDAVVSDPEGGTGDVKYHLGADATRTTRRARSRLTLCVEPEPPRGRSTPSSRG
jgi:2-oxoglutarate dehydrogenase E1 component